MATLDFTPLFRSTIGYDRLPSLLSHALERSEAGYPPYNIEKVGEDQYRKKLMAEPICTAASPRAPSSASSISPTTSRSPTPRWARACW